MILQHHMAAARFDQGVGYSYLLKQPPKADTVHLAVTQSGW